MELDESEGIHPLSEFLQRILSDSGQAGKVRGALWVDGESVLSLPEHTLDALPESTASKWSGYFWRRVSEVCLLLGDSLLLHEGTLYWVELQDDSMFLCFSQHRETLPLSDRIVEGRRALLAEIRKLLVEIEAGKPEEGETGLSVSGETK